MTTQDSKTPSLREAAQMALDALGSLTGGDVCDVSHHKKSDRHEHRDECPIVARFTATIKALRAALALPDAEPVAWMDSMGNLHFRWKDALIDESDPTALFAAPQPTEPKAAA